MKSNKVSKKDNENININISVINLGNLKSDYFLQKIFDNVNKKKSLEIVKYNKKLQNRINLSIKDYKEYSETFTTIELEIIPCKDKYGKFINNINKNDKLFYHIYFNDNKKEKNNKYTICKKDKVDKIKIIIDYLVKSFEKLF